VWQLVAELAGGADRRCASRQMNSVASTFESSELQRGRSGSVQPGCEANGNLRNHIFARSRRRAKAKRVKKEKSTTIEVQPKGHWGEVQDNRTELDGPSIEHIDPQLAEKLAEDRAIFGQAVDADYQAQIEAGRRAGIESDWIVAPGVMWRGVWDALQAFILIWLAISVPIRVGFDEQATGGLYVWSLCMDLYFWIDIALNFFFAYEDGEGNIVGDFKRIRRAYLSSWFAIDVLASLPIDMAMKLHSETFLCSINANCPVFVSVKGSSGQMVRLVKLVRMFKLVKMLRLVRLKRLLDRYQDDLFEWMGCINVCKLFTMLLFVGHLLGCFFFFFSGPEWRSFDEIERIDPTECLNPNESPPSCELKPSTLSPWLDSNFPNGAKAHSTLDKYVTAQYWAITTMTTVGYGDISASTMAERSFAIIGMLVGGFAFSGIIGAITALLHTTDPSKAEASHKLNLVTAWVRDSDLPRELRMRVMAFFRRQDVKAYIERDFLKEMPFEEREDILDFCYHKTLKMLPLFGTADEVFLMNVMETVNPVSMPMGAMVIHKGERNKSFYILQKGVVEIDRDDNADTVDQVLGAPSFFGEGALLGEAVCNDNFRAATNLMLLEASIDDMARVMDRFPDMERELRAIWNKRRENGILSTDISLAAVNNLDNVLQVQVSCALDRRHRLESIDLQLQKAMSLVAATTS